MKEKLPKLCVYFVLSSLLWGRTISHAIPPQQTKAANPAPCPAKCPTASRGAASRAEMPGTPAENVQSAALIAAVAATVAQASTDQAIPLWGGTGMETPNDAKKDALNQGAAASPSVQNPPRPPLPLQPQPFAAGHPIKNIARICVLWTRSNLSHSLTWVDVSIAIHWLNSTRPHRQLLLDLKESFLIRDRILEKKKIILSLPGVKNLTGLDLPGNARTFRIPGLRLSLDKNVPLEKGAAPIRKLDPNFERFLLYQTLPSETDVHYYFQLPPRLWRIRVP